ncbi:ice-binding family protein [Flavobacterium ardleyense]|uniref:ice-binding family protein n=1 Tax=Flavobacterium ardleyense TaxID=2038737 RepID=UPI00298C362C|nr:ice-binding family protein [Flavobacterium ardleyense]
MKLNLLFAATMVAALTLSTTSYAQAPSLGAAGSFALFSSNGAVSNTGTSHITGNVGTQNGSSTAFGNVDGVMHDQDGSSAAAQASLLVAYNQLNSATPTATIAPLLGSGQSLNAGIYSVTAPASLNGILTLNGQGNPNAVFIFKIGGAFSSGAAAQVVLTNGAVACNVFWKIEGLVDLATNTKIKGNVIANNAAIILNVGTEIEGRALSTTGAVTIHGGTVRIPLGCGSAVLTGPTAPALLSVGCYTIFSGNGQANNTGVTHITGDVGTNVGTTTGFLAANVTGTIHPIPDSSTAQCAQDLGIVYQYLNTLPTDIKLLFPAAVGQNLVLTPHTYFLDGATVLTNKLTLNAQGNANAVFVFKISGAFSTSTYAEIELVNGAQAKNVFWKIDGKTIINDYTQFKGTIVGNNGAVHLYTGVNLQGRALTTNGAVTTATVTAVMTPACNSLGLPVNEATKLAGTFYPNPFSNTLSVSITEGGNHELFLYSVTGAQVLKQTLTQSETTMDVNVPAGMYFYKIVGANGFTSTGKLVSAK